MSVCPSTWNIYRKPHCCAIESNFVVFIFRRFTQGCLNSIMGPRAKQCTGGPYYTNNCMNKQTNLMIKLNIYLLYWYFQQNQCLNIKTHVIHNIHRLSWGPYVRGAPGQLPRLLMRWDGTGITCYIFWWHTVYRD
jgi:hypothetical protein